MAITTYKMRKTLKEAETGKEVDALDFIGAVQEKKERQERRSKAYRKVLLQTIKGIHKETERNEEYRDTLEKKVKFCPKCGYKTFIENHKFICVRKCKQCQWESKPWRKDDTAFSI
jgi:NADH pyrophosphatase NudC (nudix superfamily)